MGFLGQPQHRYMLRCTRQGLSLLSLFTMSRITPSQNFRPPRITIGFKNSFQLRETCSPTMTPGWKPALHSMFVIPLSFPGFPKHLISSHTSYLKSLLGNSCWICLMQGELHATELSHTAVIRTAWLLLFPKIHSIHSPNCPVPHHVHHTISRYGRLTSSQLTVLDHFEIHYCPAASFGFTDSSGLYISAGEEPKMHTVHFIIKGKPFELPLAVAQCHKAATARREAGWWSWKGWKWREENHWAFPGLVIYLTGTGPGAKGHSQAWFLHRFNNFLVPYRHHGENKG